MFPKRLKYLRTKKKISQTEMGELLGISRQAYGKYESGASEPDQKTMIKLSAYFGVTIDYLVGHSNHPKLSEKEDIEADEYIKELEEMLKNKPDDERKRLEERILAYARGITDASDD